MGYDIDSKLCSPKLPRSTLETNDTLSLLDSKGVQSGAIILDKIESDYESPVSVTLLRVSQTTPKEGRDDPASDVGKAAYNGKPGIASTRDLGQTTSQWFDVNVYDPNIC